MEEERRVVILDVDDVLPNRFQPRIQFDEDAIAELSDSIKRYGVIQPIIVRPIADKYEIIAGERRYKATVMAQLPTIPAIIQKLNDKESAEIALVENLQRRNLTPIEEAVTYKKVLDMGYITQSELATKLGVKQSTVSNKLRLLNLDDEVQTALLENKISERHARSLLKLDTKENQRKLLNRIIKERLTVRRTDEEIKKMLTESDDDVEVLDLDSIFEEGEDKMNMNDPMNQFNIPTPVISDDNQEKPDLMSSPQQMNQQPGFLDIDRIQQEAQDIQGSEMNSTTPKFFNMGPSVESTPTYDVNQKVDFNIPPAVPSAIPTPTMEPASPVMTNVPTMEPVTPIMPSVPTAEPVTPVMTNIPTAEPVTPVMPSVLTAEPVTPVMTNIPTAEPVTPVMPSVPTAEPVTPVMPNIPTMEPVTPVMPNIPTMEPVTSVTTSVPTMEPVTPVMPSVPTTEPVTPVMPSDTIAEYRGNDGVLKPKINFAFIEAIQSVKDLKDDLENRGFVISVEENDLGTEYNFVIRVKKQS